MELAGKVVVITGAGSGIGFALKQACEKKGAVVVSCSLHQQKTDERAHAVDVRNASAVERFFRDVLKVHKRIDALVLGAGFAGTLGSIAKVTDEEYERIMKTNVDGVFHCMRAVLPIMTKQNRGLILTIASRAASKPHPLLAAYSASKAAVVTLTRAVALECDEAGLKIRCLSFSPGGVNTDMRRSLFGKEDSDAQRSPQSVADIMVTCMENAESLPNGADIRLLKNGTMETFLAS